MECNEKWGWRWAGKNSQRDKNKNYSEDEEIKGEKKGIWARMRCESVGREGK